MEEDYICICRFDMEGKQAYDDTDTVPWQRCLVCDARRQKLRVPDPGLQELLDLANA